MFAPCGLTVGAVYRFQGGGSLERGPRSLRTRRPAGFEGSVGVVCLEMPVCSGWAACWSAFPDFLHR